MKYITMINKTMIITNIIFTTLTLHQCICIAAVTLIFNDLFVGWLVCFVWFFYSTDTKTIMIMIEQQIKIIIPFDKYAS